MFKVWQLHFPLEIVIVVDIKLSGSQLIISGSYDFHVVHELTPSFILNITVLNV